MTTSVTFDVDPTKVPEVSRWHDPIKLNPLNDNFAKKYLETEHYDYKKRQTTKSFNGVILHSTAESKRTIGHIGNGLSEAICTAYNNHYPLELSPDAVWIALMTVFAKYVDVHAEQLRKHFVDHEGKKQLTVHGNGSILSADWDDLIDQMSEQIDQNTKGDTRQFVMCGFSTTDVMTETVSKVTLMCAMKNYFEYKFCLQCGLPKVRMTGKLEDWLEIRKRVDRLPEFDADGTMTKWTPILQHVLDQFVATYKQASTGSVSDELKNFWNSIVHHSGGGSGPTYLSGWILAFLPYTDGKKYYLNPVEQCKQGNYGRLDTNDIPSCWSECDVLVDDNGREYKTKFYSGLFMAEYTSEGFVRPSIDWLMVDATNAKETVVQH